MFYVAAALKQAIKLNAVVSFSHMVDKSTESPISSFDISVILTDTAADLGTGFGIPVRLRLSRCKVNKSQTQTSRRTLIVF